MSTGLYREVTHMEMWRLLIVSDQHLACSPIRADVLRSIGTPKDILPAQFALFCVPDTMNDAHCSFLRLQIEMKYCASL
jgi:DNA polymerase III psi subunit